MVSRRNFLKIGILTAATASVAGGTCILKQRSMSSKFKGAPDPIRKLDNPFQDEFSGDNPASVHGIFWNKAARIKELAGIPSPREKHKVVVVGGGISGLASCYYLRHLKPVLLEQANQFGGNAKGEQFGDLTYGLGSAYITWPDLESESTKLLNELGLKWKIDEPLHEAHILMAGQQKVVAPFWKGVTDPSRADEFLKVYKKLRHIGENEYPVIPFQKNGPYTKEKYLELDKMSFKQWLNKNFSSLHPHIKEFFEQYCWSSFCGGIDEISALQALSFITTDIIGIGVFPGGNSSVSQKLYEKLQAELPQENMKANCIVVNIRLKEKSVEVTYVENDKLHTIDADFCVVTTPKFIAKRIIENLPEKKYKAFSTLKYRAYLVANILLNKKIPSLGYDLFRLEPREIKNREEEAQTRPFTDLIFADWSNDDKSEKSALTLYRGLAYESSRSQLLGRSLDEVKDDFKKALPSVLQTVGLAEKDVLSLRVTRWGHALPLAERGLYALGVLSQVAEPLENKIFFAQQDNWANPCFETAVNTAHDASNQILSFI